MGRKYSRFYGEFWLAYLRTGTKHPKESIEIVNGLPEDAKVVGVEYRADHDVWIVVWESSDWLPVENGLPLPRLDVTIRVTQDSVDE